MINPKNELFRWGPINGRSIYCSYWIDVINTLLPQTYKYPWPETILYYIKDKMTVVVDYTELRNVGRRYFHEFILNDKEFEKAKENYYRALVKLNLIQEKVKDLINLNDQELKQLYLEWEEAYSQFWLHGLVPETANWGGEQILKEELLKILEDKNQFLTLFEKLTAPEQLSFYLEEELDLLTSKDPQEHAGKYFWINNSYFQIKIEEEDYFKQKLSEISEPEKEIKKIESLPKKTKREKEAIIEEFQLSEEIQKISERLSYCIHWQDERKKNIFIAGHYLRLFLEEIGKRKKVNPDDLEFYWCWEIKELLEDKKVSEEELRQRKEKQVCRYTDKNQVFLKDNFDAIVNPFLEIDFDPNLKEVEGLTTSKGSGVVKGKAKIVLDVKEFDKVDKGDILIAAMTSPEYILIMRKASAIITDEGGMTCHAAIVSRELGIPCLVATKFATKLFKDDDLVEVDPEKGLVKKV